MESCNAKLPINNIENTQQNAKAFIQDVINVWRYESVIDLIRSECAEFERPATLTINTTDKMHFLPYIGGVD